MKYIIGVITAFVMGLSGTAQAQYLLENGRELAPLDRFLECESCPEMIVLPLGDFRMGGPIGDSRFPLIMRDGSLALAEIGGPEIGTDERPVHTVKIDIPIAMGRNEVTYDQWMACVDDGGCGGYVPESIILSISDAFETVKTPVRGSHPVINISYLDAVGYVTWLNEKLGIDAYRLPTEAEWEYAARANTQTRFAQGDELSPENAIFYWGEDSAKYGGYVGTDQEPLGKPVPVEMLDAANQWGLRHMSGNVGERTSSCYSKRYAGWSTSSEWLKQSRVTSCKRARRGGDYGAGMDFLRVASRGAAEDTTRTNISGFRVVREMN